MIFDQLNLIFYCFVDILLVLSFEFLKFRILEILNSHPCIPLLANLMSVSYVHQRHCDVSLSKNINPSSALVQPRKTSPYITERLLMGRKESNKKRATCYIA